MIYIIITSILILSFSFGIYILLKSIRKLLKGTFTELYKRILEYEAHINELNDKYKDAKSNLSKIFDEINSLSIRLYKLENKVFSQPSSEVKLTKEIRATSEKEKEIEKVELNQTQIKILELLREGSKSSREIRSNLKLSREHVSRELKFLYETGYVRRFTDSKPYIYEISKKGLEVIEKI